MKSKKTIPTRTSRPKNCAKRSVAKVLTLIKLSEAMSLFTCATTEVITSPDH